MITIREEANEESMINTENGNNDGTFDQLLNVFD